MGRDVWILEYGGIELNEKKQTRNKKNKSMDERNAKLNSQKGKKAKAKARAPKVERNGNIEAQVAERELKQKQTL
jgi:hypothetical protein